MIMKFIKKIAKILGSVLGASLIAVFLINFNVYLRSKPHIFSESGALPKAEVALVLGAQVFDNGRLSDMLKDRADTAVDLYNSGKVNKILASGARWTTGYDEATAMKNYLLGKGIKGEDIFLDHAGFDTYDSLYRAKEIFQVRSVAIISQNFHLPRAVYIGRSLGLNAYGVSADKHSYANIQNNIAREIFADVKAFSDINLSAKPKFLGPPVPLSGDSKKSWD